MEIKFSIKPTEISPAFDIFDLMVAVSGEYIPVTTGCMRLE